MRFDVLTLFPRLFDSYLTQSLLKLAIERGLVEIHAWDFRDWSKDKHKKVDDRPFGGGPGMVLMCEPVLEAVEAVQAMAQPPGQVQACVARCSSSSNWRTFRDRSANSVVLCAT